MLELTFSQARALFILAARKGLTVSQLVELLNVGNPTVSILVRQLVKRGLATRTEQATDRRHTILSLSQKGAELGAGRRSARKKQWQRWLSNLRNDELGALASGLSALTNVVRKEAEKLTQQCIDFESLPAETSQ